MCKKIIKQKKIDIKITMTNYTVQAHFPEIYEKIPFIHFDNEIVIVIQPNLG